MKLIKMGLFLAVFLLLANILYSSTYVNVTLANDKFGASSNLDGNLVFNFTDIMPLNEQFLFYVDDLTYPISLENALKAAKISFTLIKQKYDAKDGSNEITVTGSGIKSGFDLRGGTEENPREPEDVEVLKVSFNIKSTTSPVDDVKINMGNNRVYRYKGEPKNFVDMDKGHLGSFSLQGSSVDILSGNIFCQRMNITDSGEYNIKVVAKKESANSDLNVTMSDNPESFTPDCSNPETPCCTIKNFDISNSFSETNCILKKNIPERKEQYVCVYPTNQDSSDKLFELRVITSPQNKRGYVSGEPSEWNFYIYGQYRNYDRKLQTGSSDFVQFSPDFFNNYINECESDCLIIPLNITMANNVPLQLYNLTLGVLINGQTQITEREFKEIDIKQRSAIYTGTVNVGLSDFDNVLTPAALGNDYEFYVSFNGADSNKLNFNVVDGPKAVIRYGPFNPGINEVATFDASSSTVVEGRNITSYSWDFGDGKNAKGIKTKHSYNETGDYRVKLKVTDSEGIYSIDTITVKVQEIGVDAGELINMTLNYIENFEDSLATSSVKVQDTAELLNITSKVNNFKTELNNLYGDYEDIATNSSLNDTEKNILLSPIKQRVNAILNDVPVSLTVDSSTFDSGVSSLAQIPNCCEFYNDELKTKLFISQKGVDVSSEARIINLDYINGESESFMIMKKNIVGSGTKVYEFTPFGFSIQESLNGIDFTVPQLNIYTFGFTNQLIYRIDSTNLAQALQTRTVVLPSNLEGVNAEEIKEVDIGELCGNNICEQKENTTDSCPKDCQPNRSLVLGTSLIVLLFIVLIIYFGWLFRGGLLKKLGNTVKNLFKTERDYGALKIFIDNALGKGVDLEKMKVALKSKGWSERQIDKALADIKSEKTHPKK